MNPSIIPTTNVVPSLLTTLPQDVIDHVISGFVGTTTEHMMQQIIEEMRFLFGDQSSWDDRLRQCNMFINERQCAKHLQSTDLVWRLLQLKIYFICAYIHVTDPYEPCPDTTLDGEFVEHAERFARFFEESKRMTVDDLVRLSWIPPNIYTDPNARGLMLMGQTLTYIRVVLDSGVMVRKRVVSFQTYCKMVELLSDDTSNPNDVCCKNGKLPTGWVWDRLDGIEWMFSL